MWLLEYCAMQKEFLYSNRFVRGEIDNGIRQTSVVNPCDLMSTNWNEHQPAA